MNKINDLNEQLNFDNQDKESYEVLFKGLKKLPSEELPVGLADKVMQKIQSRELSNNQNLNTILFIGITIIILSILAGAFFVFGIEKMKEIKDISTWAVLIGIMVVGIQYLDKKLLHKKIHPSGL